MSLATCDRTGCTGHLGKFDSCLAEALYDMSNDGMWGDGTGDTDLFGQYATIIILAEPVQRDISDAADGTDMIDVPAGNYIVSTNSQGFVYLAEYDTEAEARKVFSEIDTAYSAFLGDDE